MMDLILWRHAEVEDAPASSEQGSQWDANVRESGAKPSSVFAIRRLTPWI